MSLKITENDHIQGNKDAKIELIEYADYQCPYCGQAFYVIEEVQKNSGII